MASPLLGSIFASSRPFIILDQISRYE